MTDPRFDVREAWSGWRGNLKRLVLPHIAKILVLAALTIVVYTWSTLRAVVATPRAQAELAEKVDSLAANVYDMRQPFWATVALQCLALPSDSSRVMSILPCSRAYREANIRTPDGRPWR